MSNQKIAVGTHKVRVSNYGIRETESGKSFPLNPLQFFDYSSFFPLCNFIIFTNLFINLL